MRLRRTTSLETIDALDAICFPGEPLPAEMRCAAAWWIISDAEGPVAYAGAQTVDGASALFLCRAGVLPRGAGRGLQRRLIRARLRWARRLGVRVAITYTVPSNPRSSNNLIRTGWSLYEPDYAWAGRGQIYWRHDV